MTPLRIITREEIQAQEEIRIELFPVPEWGEDFAIGLQYWSGAYREKFDIELQRRKPDEKDEIDLAGMKAFCLSLSIVDEHGQEQYEETDVEEIGRLNGELINRLFAKVQEMNGIGAKAVEDLEGNLNGESKDDNGSGSPDNSTQEASGIASEM